MLPPFWCFNFLIRLSAFRAPAAMVPAGRGVFPFFAAGRARHDFSCPGGTVLHRFPVFASSVPSVSGAFFDFPGEARFFLRNVTAVMA